MPGFNEIPSEVLQQIFTYVQTSDEYKRRWMVQYQLVCKGWNKVAKTWLYSLVDLYDDTIIEKFLHCMKNSSAGHLTRTICLSTRYRKYEAAELYMNELIEACPNVERVKGPIRNYGLWCALATAASKHWLHIKELTNPFLFIKRRNYFDCYKLISLFRHSLTHVYLPPEHPSTPIMKEICQRLPEFSNLTHLTVEYRVCPWPLVDYDEIIQLCPSLASLSVNSRMSLLDAKSRSLTTHDMLSIQPHKNITTLHVFWSSHQDNVEYIMHKFPNLQNLILQFGYCDSFALANQLEDYFASVGDRLMEYLSSMQTYEIGGTAPFSLFEAYLKHTTGVHVCFESMRGMYPNLTLQQTRMARIRFRNTSGNKERLLQMLQRHQHNITSFFLNFKVNNRDSTAWIEDILTTCTQMKTLHYWTFEPFQPPSQAAIDANVPLNSTLDTLTLRVREIESGSLTGYLRLLPSVRHVNVKIICLSMDEVESRVDMLLDSFDTAPSNAWPPQGHYSSLTDVFGRKALLEIDDRLSDKEIYLVDIQCENGATRKWTKTVNENPLIKIFVDINPRDLDYMYI